MGRQVLHYLRVKTKLPNSFSRGIGRRLRHAREARGMTQGHVANLVGCRQATVSEYEAGKILPSLYVFWRLSEILGVGMCDLAGQRPLGHSPHKPAKVSPIKSLHR